MSYRAQLIRKRMKRISILLVSVAVATMCTNAPKAVPESMKGPWSGEIEKLGLALTLHLGDTCSVDSPDQGAYGLKAELKKVDGESVSLKFPEFHASLQATIQGDSLIGTFKQMGIKSPIRMGRGELVRNRPQTPVPPFPYEAEEVSFSNGDISLAALITANSRSPNSSVLRSKTDFSA